MGQNYSNLSFADLEELIHDLLEAKWKTPLESFKTGRDQGIDLRYAPADGGATIIQCKHYLGSGFKGLRDHLRTKELPKIRRLRPERYVLATSLPLLVEEKDKLVALLAPHLKSAGDIYDGTRIDALLREFPAVELAHHKLWLTSTAVHQRVLHAAEACKTEFQIDRILKALPIYVQTKAYDQAMQILRDEKVLVISGLPGVGKSTLAEMLIYAHMADDYAPAVIEDHVKEGRKLFDRQTRNIFYFDDFLGETFLGDRKTQVGRNHDDALLEFMEQVRGSQSRFILTTREHILSSALLGSERLAQGGLAEDRFILELGHYGRAERARILYNHIQFSTLSDDHRDALIRDDFFLEIVDHKHFNPRVIQWLTNVNSIRKVAPTHYQAHARALLANPAEVWRHAFENEISRASRYLLLTLYTVSHNIQASDLRGPFEALYRHAAQRYNLQTGPGDFRRALRELDNAFITIDATNAVRFLNPSIRDYVASVLNSSVNDVEDLVAAMTRFQQGASLWALGQAAAASEVSQWIDANRLRFLEALAGCLDPDYRRWERRNGALVDAQFDQDPVQRLGVLFKIGVAWRIPQTIAVTAEAARRLVDKWASGSVDFTEAVGLVRSMTGSAWFMSSGGAAIVQVIEDGLSEHLEQAMSWHWVAILSARDDDLLMGEKMCRAIDEPLTAFLEDGPSDELSNADSEDDLQSLLNNLETLEERYGFSLRSDIERVQEAISDFGYRGDDEGRGSSGGPWRSPPSGTYADDDEIRRLFGAR